MYINISLYIYMSNLAISIYIILDPLTPSGKSTENRRRKWRGSGARTTAWPTWGWFCAGPSWGPSAGGLPPTSGTSKRCNTKCANSWRTWKTTRQGRGLWFLQHQGPGIKLTNNFAKGNLYVPCNETYPTCETQSRCFKPLSIGGQVQDCSFETHIWQD